MSDNPSEPAKTATRIGGAGAQNSGRPLFVKPQQRPGAENRERLMSGKAWADFCDALKRSGEHMLSMDIRWDEESHIDIYHYLMGIVQGGIRTALDHADPAVPLWVENGTTIKHSGDNADNYYLIARLDPKKTYRISGNRGSCHAMMLEVSEGYMQQGDMRTFETVNFDERYATDTSGDFEILASGAKQEGNWLPIHADGHQLIIRMFFLDWEKEKPATVRIEEVDHIGQPPAPVGPVRMAQVLDDAAAWIESNALFWLPWMEEYHQQADAGEFNQAQAYAGGAKDIRYGNNGYRLGSDEVLLLEGLPPEARYWSFQLQNNAMVSMDYRNHQTSLNSRQIHLDKDGRYRIVVAHEDPGVANWLDTCGRPSGLLIWRWVWTANNPDVSIRRVQKEELRHLLPADTRFTTPAERRKVIAMRQRHVARRYASN